MDIAALSTAMSLANVQSSWGTAMLSKSLDQSEVQGAQITDMIASAATTQMELSVNPSVGANFDIRV